MIQKRFAYLLTSYFISSVCNLLSLKFYSQRLGQVIFGEFMYVQGIFLLINLVLSSTLTQIVYKFNHVFGSKNIKIVSFIFSILLSVSAIVLIIYLALFDDNLFKDQFIYVFLIFLILVIVDVINSLFQVNNSLKSLLVSEILKSVCKLTIPLAFIFYYGSSLDAFLLGFICSHLVVLGVQLALYGFFHQPNAPYAELKLNKDVFWQVFKYISPIFFWTLSIQFINYSDRFFVSQIVTYSNLGIYFANFSIFNFASQLITYPLVNSAHPILIRHSPVTESEIKNFEFKLNELKNLFIISSVTFGYLCIIFYDDVVSIILNKEFLIDRISIFIIVLSNITWNVGSYTNKPFEVSNNTKFMLYVLLISLGIYLINSYFFIESLGIKYVAVIKLFSFFLYVLILKMLAFKLNLLNWRINFITFRFFISSTLLILIFIYSINIISIGSHALFSIKFIFSLILLFFSYLGLNQVFRENLITKLFSLKKYF